MNSFQLYIRTIEFTILRVIASLACLIPLYSFTLYLADVFKYILDEPDLVPQILRPVFDGAYLFLAMGVALPASYFLQKILFNYIRMGHIIILTRLIVQNMNSIPRNGHLPLALKEMCKYFFKVHVFFLCDSMVSKSINDISGFLSETEAVKRVTDKFPFLKIFTKYIKMTVNFSDELIFSYLYYRIRIDKEYNVKTSIKKTCIYAVEGLSFYVKSCFSLLKDTIILAIKVQIFQIIVTVIYLFVVLFSGWFEIKSILILLVSGWFVYQSVEYLLVEPYYLVSSLTSFYKFLDKDDVNLKEVPAQIATISESFGNLCKKSGLDISTTEGSASGLDAIFQDNITTMQSSEFNAELDKDIEEEQSVVSSDEK